MQTRTIELKPDQRRLLVDGKAVELGSRAFDILQALAERRDRVVSKNELLDLVWPDTIVEENNLQVHVSALRKVLGPTAIATIPGRGYRLTLDLTTPEAPAGAAPAGPAVQPPAASVGPGNVPTVVEPPIGREAELAALRSLVGEHRLVSIVGAGGIGKTTVALALADALRASFPDGVWWIELATITEGTLVPEAVARGLGVGLASGRSPVEALASAIEGMNVLVVLDNCEHLVDAVSELVDAALRRVPTVRFAVTSQEPLRVPREYVFRLQPLTTPPADAPLTPALASGFTAIALFTERATAVDRRFQLSAANVGGVADICRRLDGIPLAIELAAARVSMMGVEALQQRLDERFRVLTAGARTVLRRHQTLRATLEWSHGLLSADEKAVFRRLGVFSGGASLALVQAVARDEALDEWAVLSALGTLVDKSLVVADGGDAPRYRLLETARAYALEQLAAAGETAAWIRRHACAVHDMLAVRTRNTWVRDRIPELAFELDNVRTAVEWALGDHGDPALAVALVAHAFPVWRTSVSQAEGLRLAKAAVSRLDDSTPTPTRARFWLTYAALGMFSGRADCFEAAGQAAGLMRSLGNTEGLYEALGLRAAIAARRVDLAAARAALDEAQRIEDPAWPPSARTLIAFASWITASYEGRHADARVHAQRQTDLARAGGRLLEVQLGLGNVAASDVWGGEPARGAAVLRSVIAELERIGAGNVAGHACANLAEALLQLGELDQALIAARRAFDLLRREADQWALLWTLPRLAAARGEPAVAVKIAGYARDYWNREGIRLPWLLAPEELAPSMSRQEREALLREGAALGDDEAFGLLLSDGSQAPSS
jgi:predicted ATPase/DNA-binding winged helix-turn-helix (wHTH) protein